MLFAYRKHMPISKVWKKNYSKVKVEKFIVSSRVKECTFIIANELLNNF